jgi:putative sterol carrier protein
MSGFSDAKEAKDVIAAVFQQIDTSQLQNLNIVYSYRFTDIDWSFTVSVQGGAVTLSDGILPESETTIETTSDVFDKVMTGQMNVIAAHVSNKARIQGSVGNVLKFRTIVPAISDAYRAVMAQRNPAQAG